MSKQAGVRLTFGGLWRHPDFLRLWTGQTVSVFGSMVGGAAMSFTAILYLHASPFQMALLAAARESPAFLAAFVAGVWVDRLRRRPILMVTDLGRAALLASIPAAALAGALRIEQVYAVAFLTSVLTLLFDVAYQSYLPSLVRADQLLEGNSKLTATASIAEFGGFSLAGWLVQWLSGPVAILIDAVSFVVSAGSVLSIRAREAPPSGEEPRAPDLRREIAEGLRLIRGDAVLRALAAVAALLGLAQGVVGSMIVLFMTRDLGFQPGVLGMIWAVGGVTSFFGAAMAAPAARRLGAGGAMAAGLVFSGLGTLLVPLAQGTTALSTALLVGNQVLTDPAHTLYLVNEVSLRQSIVPHRLLGRVAATLRFLALGATLAGSLAGGLLGERVGLRPILVAGAAGTIVAGLWLRGSPVGRVAAR